MKNIIYTLVLAFVSSSMFAQDAFEQGMGQAFQLWQEGKTTESAALFERISNAEKDNWLPPYYAANVLIVSTFSEGTMEEKDAKLEKAKTLIAEAHKRSEDNSEIYTMEGVLYTGYVAMDPGTYAMQLSNKIMNLHSKAVELDPENPRAQFNMVEYEMGGAKFFNQDLSVFCERIEKTIPLFENQKSEGMFYPSYGIQRAQEALANCGK